MIVTPFAAKLQRRALARRAMQSVERAENRYAADLRGLMTSITDAYIGAMVNVMRHDPRMRQDISEYDDETYKVTVGVSGLVRRPVETAFNRMAGLVIGAVSAYDIGLQGVVDAAREQNLMLIENAGRHYAADVREIFSRPDVLGMRVESIRKLLKDKADITIRHADLIARDQTLKLNGAVNKTRQMNAGVTEYTWSGVMDARERPSHVALEGKTFSWLGGTPIGYHPGEDYQCRCVALPVLD